MYEPVDLFDTAAARAVDAQATTLFGGDAFELMQRDGEAAWRYLLQHWPQAHRIVVVCGSGNNGGDGYVLARLAVQSGRRVRVMHLRDGGPRTASAQRACTEYLGCSGGIDLFERPLEPVDLVVDALFGIGLSRAPDAEAAALIAAINDSGAPVLSLDVASGVDAQTGQVAGLAVRATRTLQFIVAHQGLYTGAALEHGGELALADLDVPAAALQGIPTVAQRWTQSQLVRQLPPRRLNTHKGESGHVLCIGGNHGSGGAVMLAAESALRAGAGLATVATRSEHVAPLLTRCPEAMPRAIEDPAQLLPLLECSGVIAIGPGMGQDDWARALWQQVTQCGRPLVVDADALNLLAEAPVLLEDAVLTPHPGEASRLLGVSIAQIQADRFSAARALAERHAAVVVLKGAGTIVCAPAATPRVIAAGNPGMAVGGMGDLLTGVIAALRAQGLSAFDAASTGALLHSSAGDLAAAEGQRGLLPRDLLPHLRRLANP